MLAASQYEPSVHSSAWSMQAAPIDFRTAHWPTGTAGLFVR